MAGRFLLQKISSRMSRLKNLLDAHAHASSRAAASYVSRSSEAGIKTLSNVFHGAAVHPGTVVPNNHGIHGCAARYLNTLACSSVAAKTSWSTTGMPSTIINHKNSALVNSVGSKQTFSSVTPNKHEHSWEAKLAAWRARGAAWGAKKRERGFDEDYMGVFWMIFFIGCCLVPLPEAPRTSGSNSLNNSYCCSACCNCPCHGPKPEGGNAVRSNEHYEAGVIF